MAFVSLKSSIFLQFYKGIKFCYQNPTPGVGLFHSLKATLYGICTYGFGLRIGNAAFGTNRCLADLPRRGRFISVCSCWTSQEWHAEAASFSRASAGDRLTPRRVSLPTSASSHRSHSPTRQPSMLQDFTTLQTTLLFPTPVPPVPLSLPPTPATVTAG